MAIYTKTGDRGETSILSQNQSDLVRIRKDSQVIRTIGSIDEVNSYLGVVRSSSTLHEETISSIQSELFLIGSILAGSKLSFKKEKIRDLETKIDKMEGTLPVLKNFILPGGTIFAANLNYARSLVRKAERSLVTYSKKNEVDPNILSYINRLSDFLFMLARLVNFESGTKEKIWKPNS